MFGRLGEVSLRLLSIVCDARRICRLSLIFRYLLRPEMMVIYTSNTIYGFPAKNSKPPRGEYTQDTQFSDITPNLRTARPPPRQPLKTSISHQTLSILSNQNTHAGRQPYWCRTDKLSSGMKPWCTSMHYGKRIPNIPHFFHIDSVVMRTLFSSQV